MRGARMSVQENFLQVNRIMACRLALSNEAGLRIYYPFGEICCSA